MIASETARNVLNFLLFQAGWFACVFYPGLIGAGIAPPDYIAAQGLELGRNGRVYITSEGQEVWVGGEVTACISGTLTL